MPKISNLEPIAAINDADEVAVRDVSAVSTRRMSLGALVTWLQSKLAWITTAMLATSAVTTPKTKLSIISWYPPSGGTHGTTSTTMVDVPGASWTYTSGATAERIFMDVHVMSIINGGSAVHVGLMSNGVDLNDEILYSNANGHWARQSRMFIIDIPANTTYTFKLRHRTENGTINATTHMDNVYRPSARGFAISNE